MRQPIRQTMECYGMTEEQRAKFLKDVEQAHRIMEPILVRALKPKYVWRMVAGRAKRIEK